MKCLFEKKGWLEFVETKLPVNASYVAYFYAHLHTPDPSNTSILRSFIEGASIDVTNALIRRLFKLPVGSKKAYGHKQIGKRMGFDMVEASTFCVEGLNP